MVLLQLFDTDIGTDLNPCAYLYITQIQDPLDFIIKQFPRCSITRDPVVHHATQLFLLFKNRCTVPSPTKLVRRSQTGRPTSNNRNALTA